MLSVSGRPNQELSASADNSIESVASGSTGLKSLASKGGNLQRLSLAWLAYVTAGALMVSSTQSTNLPPYCLTGDRPRKKVWSGFEKKLCCAGGSFIPGDNVLIGVLKHTFARIRPSTGHHTFSFPSGHAAAGTSHTARHQLKQTAILCLYTP